MIVRALYIGTNAAHGRRNRPLRGNSAAIRLVAGLQGAIISFRLGLAVAMRALHVMRLSAQGLY